MAQDNTHQTAKIAGVAAASAAVGAAVAMLLTPKSGREMREKIAEKAKNVEQKAADMPGKTGTTNGA